MQLNRIGRRRECVVIVGFFVASSQIVSLSLHPTPFFRVFTPHAQLAMAQHKTEKLEKKGKKAPPPPESESESEKSEVEEQPEAEEVGLYGDYLTLWLLTSDIYDCLLLSMTVYRCQWRPAHC